MSFPVRACVFSPPKPSFLSEKKKRYRLEVVFINITLDAEGVMNKDTESQHVSALKGPVCLHPL